ncbi:hypothetical protein Hanom_Chr05g00415781 [Helianthus anomalus]
MYSIFLPHLTFILFQVHGKKTIKNIHQDIEMIHGKYVPYQFLVYWLLIMYVINQACRYSKLNFSLPCIHYMNPICREKNFSFTKLSFILVFELQNDKEIKK